MGKTKISVVTGTLNRLGCLPGLIANTVDDCEDLELVLVDGGSTDGTIEYLKRRAHPRINLIEIGHRSSYPHYMNTGIKAARHDHICVFNDDVILDTSWRVVQDTIAEGGDVLLFSWWNAQPKEWSLYYTPPNEVVINYGIVRRKVFEIAGLYHPGYRYYCADGYMGFRAWAEGFVVVPCNHIRVIPLGVEKRAIYYESDMSLYQQHLRMMRKKDFPGDVEKLEPRK